VKVPPEGTLVVVLSAMLEITGGVFVAGVPP
jgi:hypothetical protein